MEGIAGCKGKEIGGTSVNIAALSNQDEHTIIEKISGKEVLMSPRPAMKHLEITARIHHLFDRFLAGKRCKTYIEAEVHLDEDNIFVPDVLIICDKNKIKANWIDGAPDLVVEVLSASTAARDKGIKKTAYEKAGVKEYWIVDPGSESIDVYHLQDGRLEFADTYIIYPEWEWKSMTEEQRAAARLSVKVSLYDDLIVDVREVFEDAYYNNQAGK